MRWFGQGFDPYDWLQVRRKGKGLYFVDYGLLPGLVAGVGYAVLMAFMGSAASPYLNAALFAVVVTPIYVWLSHRTWELNEDAFAVWVADEGRRLMALEENTGNDR